MKRALAAVLVVVGCGLVAGAARADGSGIQVTAQGWWSRLQNKSLPTPAPPPPNVQPGQLDVQGDPSGVIAMAAFRASLGPQDANPTLTLSVASDTGGSNAILLACTAGSAWTPVENGDFNDAPHVDTTKCVNARRSADGATFTVPLGALQFGTNLDVVLVPGTDPALPAGANGSTFQLVFAKIEPTAIATTAGSPPTLPTPSESFGAGSGAAASLGSTGTSPAFHAPASAPVVPTPAIPADKAGATATSPVQQAATAPEVTVPAASTEDGRARLFGVVVLVVGAGLGLWAWRDDNLARLAVATAGANGANVPEAGLGRFVRPRQGTPPALS